MVKMRTAAIRYCLLTDPPINHSMKRVIAGAAEKDITPVTPQFLYGYPYVERWSEGVHDRLMSSALYLKGAEALRGSPVAADEILFIANDIIYLDKALVAEARRRITDATGIPGSTIMITATHTHSAPIPGEYACTGHDPVIPAADPQYRELLVRQIAAAGTEAVRSAQPASLGFGVTRAEGIGTNRRDPAGPRDPEVPLIVVRDRRQRPLACMLVCSMHPTVLHEGSRLISGDFPAFARHYLRDQLFGAEIPVIYHTGTAGDQSPRYVTRSNTFDEAQRLGHLLGEAVARSTDAMEFSDNWVVAVTGDTLDLPRRTFPDVQQARKRRDAAKARLAMLRESAASPQQVRTAETDWFGAEETLTFSELAQRGRLERFYTSCLPAEVQVVRTGPVVFAALPGELFVEYGLELRRRRPGTFAITLANGDVQGYIVTREAADNGGYEASNAIFHWSGGPLLVEQAVALVDALPAESAVQ